MTIGGSFAVQVKEARTRQGVSLRQLAKKTKISFQFLWDVETGRREASWKNMQKIAAALGITVCFETSEAV
jgi:transcriptional regulator with XRE-family HTH domain